MKKCLNCGTEYEGACCPNCGVWAAGEKIALNLGLELIKYEGNDADFTVPDRITRISEEAFAGNGSLKSVVIPQSVNSVGEKAFCGCAELTSVVLPSGLKKIGENAFGRCTKLKNIVIPVSVESIGENAFSDCINATIYCEAATAPDGWDKNWNGSDCPVVWDCGNEDVKAEEYEYAVIKGIKYALHNGKALVSAQPHSVTEAVIPTKVSDKKYTYGVTGIENYAFYNCKELKKVVVSEGVTHIGGSAFAGCYGLKSVTLPDSVTDIDGFAFGNCLKLTHVHLGKNLKVVSGSTFAGCVKLSEIDFPENLTQIGYAAFNNCRNLSVLSLPSSLTKISDFAFANCKALTCINFTGSKSRWKSITKNSSWNKGSGKFVVVCADGILDKNGEEIPEE